MLQRILVALDGSPLAETTLPHVSALAKGLGAEVSLLHVIDLPDEIRETGPHATVEQLHERARLQANDYLHGVEQRLKAQGVKVRSVVTAGDAAKEIVASAQREGIDLVAVATHGRSGLQRWLYGSVAEEVLHTSRTPLLLIRPTDAGGTAPVVSRIVVPLDGSPLAEVALTYAETLASALKVPVVLLRAIETVYVFGEPTVGAATGYQELLESLQEAAETYLEQAASGLRSKGISVDVAAPLGFPATEIEQYTRDHPGTLVVMATHGRTGVAGLLLGSVARRVVQRGGVPILLVRPTAPPLVAD